MSILMSALFLCQADCMVVNLNEQWVELLGSVEATSKRSKLEAHRLMKRDCKKLVAKKYKDDKDTFRSEALLVKSFDYYKRDENWSEHQSSSYSSPWIAQPLPNRRYYFSRSTHSTRYNQYYSNDEFMLNIDFARALDSEVCGRIEENKDAVPVYTGDENPLG